MKKKNKQNLLPKELQQFEILTERKFEQVTGGDIRHRINNSIWRDIFLKRK